jgi:hypothetical protein
VERIPGKAIGSTFDAFFGVADEGAFVTDVIHHRKRRISRRLFDDLRAKFDRVNAETLTTGLGQFRGDGHVGPGRTGSDDLGRDVGHATFHIGDGAVALVLHGGGQHDVGVRESRATVTGNNDNLGRFEGRNGAVDVEDVAEKTSAQQQHRCLRSGAHRVELFSRAAPIVLGVIAPTGAKAWAKPHVQRATNVRASQCRQESGRRKCFSERAHGRLDDTGRLGHVGTTDDKDHSLAVTNETTSRVELCVGDRRVLRDLAVTTGQRLGDHVGLARAHRHGHRRERTQSARAEGELDQRVVSLYEVLTQAQKQDGQFLANVAGQGDYDSRMSSVVNRRRG